MRYFRLILLALCSWACACSTPGRLAYHPDRKLAPQQLQEDFKAMEQTLKRNHPSLYWYSSPQEIDAAFTKGRSRLNDSLTELQFKNIIAEALMPIRCGHTSVRSSVRYTKYYRKQPRPAFPLSLKVTDDSTLVITINRQRRDSILKRGMVVSSIDGRSSANIIDSLRVLVPIDGYAVNFAYQNLSNNFPFYFQNRFGTRSSYLVEYRKENGTTDTLRVRPYQPERDTTLPARISPPERTPAVRRPTPTGEGRLIIDSTGKHAVMTLNSFDRALKRSFLRSSFRSLKKQNIPHLVIDIRNNGGGLIKHSLILTRYIRREPFVYLDSAYAKKRILRGSARILQRRIHNLGMLLSNRRISDSMFAFRYFRGRSYSPLKNAYAGKVWVITGGYTFSAASLFASQVKGQSNVQLIGEETGGAYYGNNGIFIPDFRLPHSGLRVRLPVYRIVTNSRFIHNGRGALPDLEVKPTVETIRRNADPKMEKVLELIRKHSGR